MKPRALVQVKICLACTNKVKRTWNEEKKIFEGPRICKSCKQTQKMKYLPAYNGG